MLLQMAKINSFLWLNSIPVCVCVCVCTYTYHIFSMHSSADKHLGCFHISAIVNNAATLGCVYLCELALFFSYTYAGVELLGHMVEVFEKLPYCFP